MLKLYLITTFYCQYCHFLISLYFILWQVLTQSFLVFIMIKQISNYKKNIWKKEFLISEMVSTCFVHFDSNRQTAVKVHETKCVSLKLSWYIFSTNWSFCTVFGRTKNNIQIDAIVPETRHPIFNKWIVLHLLSRCTKNDAKINMTSP